jgi:hypothetical protein
MKAITAVCLVLSGLSLWLAQTKQVNKLSGVFSFPTYWVARVCAVTVQIIGLFTLSQYIFGWNSGIDDLLFRSDGISVTPYYSGAMGLNTGLNFILIGRALDLGIKPKSERSYWFAQVLALLACVISGLAVMGYTYHVESLYHMVPKIKSMALNTAVSFALLGIGIMDLHKDQGFMRLVTNNTYNGLLARRLFVAAIIVPLMLGWLILQGQRAGLYDPALAISLLVVVLIISFSVLIWHNAALVELVSEERDRIKQALRVKEEKLNSLVEANIIGIIFADTQGNIQQANDEFLRMIGCTQEDLQANDINWISITPPEYKAQDDQSLAEAKIKGACTPHEKEYIRKDHSRVPVLVGYTLVGETKEELVAFILDLSVRKKALEALRHSEERFRLAVDNIPDCFVIYDALRRFQFINTTALDLFQKSYEEVIGRTDEEILPTEVCQSYLPTLIKAQETGTLQTTEATVNFPHHRTLFMKYVPILDEKGQIYQILGFADDITVRKQAEEALSNQQKWLEEVLNLMPTPLLFIEPGTAKVTFANKAADEVAGGTFPKAKSVEDYHTIYYSTDANGNPILDEQAPGIRVARGERIEGFELDWHTPTDTKSLLIFADTLPKMHGHPATCVLTFQDITNLKQVEKALSLGYQRLHLLFNVTNDLLSSHEPAALVASAFKKLKQQIGLDVYFNYLVKENSEQMRLESYSGITEEAAKEIEWLALGQAVCGKVALERRPIAVENLQQSTDLETTLVRSFGVTAYYCYPLIARGQLLGTLSFGSRSRQKFSANQIGMMQAVCDQIAIAMERARLIGSLQQQTEQLREANRMKDEFLAILSHELRSPLNAILGWAQLLHSHKLDENKIAKAIETIERNARAQKQLIEDLLDISRMIRGKLRLQIRTCSLALIIESAIDTVRLAAEAKGIDLRFSVLDYSSSEYGELKSKIPSPKFLVSGDAERLQQVMWNLLSNAIKFTPSSGRVEIKLQEVEHESRQTDGGRYCPSFAKMTVSDTGIGIKSEFLPYVFDRFCQADSSITRSHGGLGLGLAIVRHLVELHGGNVYVESLGEGKGATFTVILPLMNRKEEQQERQTQRITQETSPVLSSLSSRLPSSLLEGVKVLVVDDEADTREYVSATLKQYQAEVMVAGSVQEALGVIQKWKPDVLVSDIGMPEEDGYSLIRKVRKREALKERRRKVSQNRRLRRSRNSWLKSYADECTVPTVSSTGEGDIRKASSESSIKNTVQRRNIPAAALTAYARSEDRARAIQEGFQTHLPKPIEPLQLALVVANLAGRM